MRRNSQTPSPDPSPSASHSAFRTSYRLRSLAVGLVPLLGAAPGTLPALASAAPPGQVAPGPSPPHAPAARTGFYGLGWNVSDDDEGRLRLSHTGAFALGAHTDVTMLPGEQLGIVVLTNGAPAGVADAVALDFFDIARNGEPSRDWIPLVDALYEQQADEGRSTTDYAHPPSGAALAKAADTYAGTYENAYYGRAEVVAGEDGALTLRLGPKPQTYRLTHYDGDTFSFPTASENAVGLTGVTFTPDGKSLTVEYLDTEGLGTFTRPGQPYRRGVQVIVRPSARSTARVWDEPISSSVRMSTSEGSSVFRVTTRTDCSGPPTSRATTTGVSGERSPSSSSRAAATWCVRDFDPGL
ncbi:DUF3471 domain-containing protein [Streptomyces sp. ISL-36]|nr:DUF3471 domain-containing protein [Streptomyces sp. ISL-36]